MNRQELIHILQTGENTTIEYKEAKDKMPSTLFDTVVSFLNRDGGTILLGVQDNRSVIGINPAVVDKLKKEIINASNNNKLIDPPFTLSPETIEYKGKIILYIKVTASSQVHRLRGDVYDREHDCDLRIKDNNRIGEIYFRKRTIFTESKIYPALRMDDMRSDILEKARRFIRSKRVDHPWLEEDDAGMLRLANFYRRDFTTGEEGYTLAAALMFGKDETIQSILPAYKIEALLRRKDLDRWDDRLTLRTNLIDSYQLLMEFIRKHLPDKFYLDGDRRLDLRELIFREIVANIIIHREYTNSLSTDLIIYEDRVETTNPNKPHLRGPLVPESFSPFPKNPLLRKFFAEMGWADEVGSGIKNVNKYLKHYVSGSAEPFFLDDDMFKTNVPLVVYTLSKKADDIFELLGIEKNNTPGPMLERIYALEIDTTLSKIGEKKQFLFALVSSWLQISTRFPGLRLSDINHLENGDVFQVPGLHEKSTKLLGKRFMVLMKTLVATISPLSLEQLMSVVEYKNRKTFKELYLYPIIENGLIERTIPGKPCSPNQEYVLTRMGRLFLGGMSV